MDLKKKVLTFIKKHDLIKPGSSLLLGVSGGADSVALLYIFHQLRHDLSLSLQVLHFNHRLRPASDKDQQFVEQLGARLNVPVIVAARPKVSGRKSVSEDQARQWRYKFFNQSLRRLNADAIVLAHHQDDIAETVLMRLIRGSGLAGLRGILPQREINGVIFIRPFLDVSRKEILAYLVQHKLGYCVDATNRQTKFFRNKVRIKLLPLLKNNFNPRINEVLLDLARISTEDYHFLQELLLQRIKEILVKLQGRVRIRLKLYNAEHPAMQRMILRHVFGLLNKDSSQLTFAHIEEIEDLIKHRPINAAVDCPRSVKVVKLKEFLEFR